MRKMLLSIKPSVYEKIANGTKIFEHRRSFPNEPIMAYMYVSSPVCAIKGILYLGKRHNLSDWKVQFAADNAAVKRIEKYEESYRYAMEIERFQETNELPLSLLRSEVSGFIVPQMYYFLEGRELQEYLEKNICVSEFVIEHSFENILSTQVCVH